MTTTASASATPTSAASSQELIRKITWRLIPYLGFIYL
jgi:hypothetical protein